jgi:hypothetical protein
MVTNHQSTWSTTVKQGNKTWSTNIKHMFKHRQKQGQQSSKTCSTFVEHIVKHRQAWSWHSQMTEGQSHDHTYRYTHNLRLHASVIYNDMLLLVSSLFLLLTRYSWKLNFVSIVYMKLNFVVFNGI